MDTSKHTPPPSTDDTEVEAEVEGKGEDGSKGKGRGKAEPDAGRELTRPPGPDATPDAAPKAAADHRADDRAAAGHHSNTPAAAPDRSATPPRIPWPQAIPNAASETAPQPPTPYVPAQPPKRSPAPAPAQKARAGTGPGTAPQRPSARTSRAAPTRPAATGAAPTRRAPTRVPPSHSAAATAAPTGTARPQPASRNSPSSPPSSGSPSPHRYHQHRQYPEGTPAPAPDPTPVADLAPDALRALRRRRATGVSTGALHALGFTLLAVVEYFRATVNNLSDAQRAAGGPTELHEIATMQADLLGQGWYELVADVARTVTFDQPRAALWTAVFVAVLVRLNRSGPARVQIALSVVAAGYCALLALLWFPFLYVVGGATFAALAGIGALLWAATRR